LDTPLLQSLFDEQELMPLTVSELNARVKLELERNFSNVWVEGEIVNFSTPRSGHWYFTLADGNSMIKAACFKNSNYRIRFKPSDGLSVRVHGRISIYEPRGEYQLTVESLEPVGEGALRVAFQQIKAKLEKEGLFADEIKRPLPRFPRKIGVVTSPTGAAFFDILHVLSRRARSVNIVLVPTRVQGESAGEEIRKAIGLANDFNDSAHAAERFDVLIVGRGGGSAEDLWAFNEEQVARAIRHSKIPVISAVGHEIDFTIADLVADVRAATPSAAAEIVASCEEDIHALLRSRSQEIAGSMQRKVLVLQNDLQAAALSPVFVDFPNTIERLVSEVDYHADAARNAVNANYRAAAQRYASAATRLSPLALSAGIAKNSTHLALLAQRQTAAAQGAVAERSEALGLMMGKLGALSPLSVLDRGFSITEKQDGSILRNAADAAAGDRVTIRLAKGKLKAEVLSTEEK
jgi:exodeoxyribonuclease VII large subunit